jgi:N-acetylneuraminic acid mutarotase
LADTPGDQGPGDALAFVRLGDEAYVYALIGAATKRRSKAFNSFLRYNVAADRWENDLPALWACTDDGAALAWDGGRSLYALQGSDCQDQATHNFARFDLQDWRWEELPSIPEPVNDGGSLVWDGARYLYAIVGEGRGAYRFDTQKSSWEELADLPCPVGYYTGNRLAVIEGKVYAWQGSPSTWECGGSALMRLDL